MRSIQWNAELDAALLSLRSAGKSFFHCQERIGISAEACRKRALALGIRTRRPLKPWPAGAEETLVSMRRAGASWTAISRRVGFPAASCSARARHLGMVTSNQHSWTPIMDRHLAAWRAQGKSWHAIGILMEVSEWGARSRGRILGLVKHKTASVAKAASEVGHPPDTAARVAASVTASLPKLGGAVHNGAPVFLRRDAA